MSSINLRYSVKCLKNMFIMGGEIFESMMFELQLLSVDALFCTVALQSHTIWYLSRRITFAHALLSW